MTDTLKRVSVASDGLQANGYSELWWQSLSSDGRYATFTSLAPDLTGDPTGNIPAVFVYDRITGTTERIPGAGFSASISADGRCVGFSVGDDVAIYDRVSQTTELISPHATGNYERSGFFSINADGRYVLFESTVSSLTGDPTGYTLALFVYDRIAHTTSLIPGSTGAIAFISADGRYVSVGLGVYDRVTGTIEHVLIATDGKATSDPTFETYIYGLSSDNRFVVFQSGASNLVDNDTNGCTDIFIYDRTANTTERVVASDGTQTNGPSGGGTISADGRYVAFYSGASNLVAGDTNGAWDAFVYDRITHTTQRISLGALGEQANGPSGGLPTISISADGQYVFIGSDASNLVPDDTNGNSDVFLIDRGGNIVNNHAPAASPVATNANEDTNILPVTLTALFADADLSDSFRFTFDPTGTKGTVTNNNDRTFTYDPNGKFEYLGLGETATDTFTYTVTDNHGASSTATATVTIHGENDAPVASPDVAGVLKGGTVTGNVGTNDHDPDIHDALLVTAVNGSSTLIGKAIKGAYGTLTLNTDGTYAYVAKNNAQLGAQDIFQYTVSDGHGGTSMSTLTVGISFPSLVIGTAQLTGLVDERQLVTGKSGIDQTSEVITFNVPDAANRPTSAIDALHQTVNYHDANGHSYALTGAQIAAFKAAFSVADAGTANAGK